MKRLWTGLMALGIMLAPGLPVQAMVEQTTQVTIDHDSGCFESNGMDYAFEGDFKGDILAFIRFKGPDHIPQTWDPGQRPVPIYLQMTAVGFGQQQIGDGTVGFKLGNHTGGWWIYIIPYRVHYMLMFMSQQGTPAGGTVDICVRVKSSLANPMLPY